jgi:tetratricopeptide (TPR) repeat protein
VDPERSFNLGMTLLKHRKLGPAVYVFKTALTSRPDVPKLWLGLGLSYSSFNLVEGEQAFRKAIALDPQYEEAYIALGDMLEQTERLDDAVAVFRKAIDVRPDSCLPYYYYGKAVLHERKGSLDNVIEVLRKSIALDPSFPDAHYELGKALAQGGKTPEAIEELERSVKLRPDLSQPHYLLGRLYKKLGDHVRAAEQFRLFEATSKKENTQATR